MAKAEIDVGFGFLCIGLIGFHKKSNLKTQGNGYKSKRNARRGVVS